MLNKHMKDCDIIQQYGRCRCNKLRWGHTGVGWSLIQYDLYPLCVCVCVYTQSILSSVVTFSKTFARWKGLLSNRSRVTLSFLTNKRFSMISGEQEILDNLGHQTGRSCELTCCRECFLSILVFWAPPWLLSAHPWVLPPAGLAPKACSAVPTRRRCHERAPSDTGWRTYFITEEFPTYYWWPRVLNIASLLNYF